MEMKANHKTIQGIVVSDKMDKTITVEVTTMKKHKLYNKYTKNTTKYKAHDEKNEAHVGDTVVIEETRPLSKDKYFRLLSIVERAK